MTEGSSNYVQDLIRSDQAIHGKQQTLQMAITQGLDSGISDLSMEHIFAIWCTKRPLFRLGFKNFLKQTKL